MSVQDDKAIVGGADLTSIPDRGYNVKRLRPRRSVCPQRTFVAASDLEGYGLFVGEDCTANRVYVGEYRGELVNENEAQERRWVPCQSLQYVLLGKREID